MSGSDPADIWQEVLSWLRVAENDRRAVKACLDIEPPLRDVAAFHCQQAAEKLLKGFLVHASIDFGKTHDLEKLGQIVAARFPHVEPLAAAMRDWTNWNIAYRYPDIGEPALLPAAEELTRALDLIANLAQMLRTLERPPDSAQITMETDP
jgi:HEPN domain-containing protein